MTVALSAAGVVIATGKKYGLQTGLLATVPIVAGCVVLKVMLTWSAPDKMEYTILAYTVFFTAFASILFGRCGRERRGDASRQHVAYVALNTDDGVDDGGGRQLENRWWAPPLSLGADGGGGGGRGNGGGGGGTTPGTAALETAVAAAAYYPSGAWRGYYVQAGSEHGVAEFDLSFRPDGAVTGGGTDEVGAYAIRGRHAANGRVAFTKQYTRGSANARGAVLPRRLNPGHTVEYRGRAAALTAGGRPALGRGVRGTWELDAGGRDAGRWHLWPVMEGWEDERSADGGGGGPGSPGGEFEAEDECCVCMDAAIGARLEPCGHICLCVRCANRLSPPQCPLCRGPIAVVRALECGRRPDLKDGGGVPPNDHKME